jgi:hypothetical protein
MTPFDRKTIPSGGVLTTKMIDAAVKIITETYGCVDIPMICSPRQYKQTLEWQRWETWVSMLSPRQQKCERLKYEIKHRKKLKPMPLPD